MHAGTRVIEQVVVRVIMHLSVHAIKQVAALVITHLSVPVVVRDCLSVLGVTARIQPPPPAERPTCAFVQSQVNLTNGPSIYFLQDDVILKAKVQKRIA